MIETERNFEKSEDLIRFVLTECADIDIKDYDFEKLRPVSEPSGSPFILSIFRNFDMMYIFYLNQLLWKFFNSYIEELYVGSNSDVDNPNFLKDLNKLQVLMWYTNTDLPELPESICKINVSRYQHTQTRTRSFFNNFVSQEIYPCKLSGCSCGGYKIGDYGHHWKSKRELLDDITKGEIALLHHLQFCS